MAIIESALGALGITISPAMALAGTKVLTGALGLVEEQKDFEKKKKLNDLRTNIQIMNIEQNEQTILEADISNKFRIELNALEAQGSSAVSAAFRGVAGKSVDEVEQEILSNEATALRKSTTELQSSLDLLADKEEQIRFDQELFNLQEPDLFSDLLNLGIDTASTLFTAGQQTGADKPFTFGRDPSNITKFATDATKSLGDITFDPLDAVLGGINA